MEVFADLLKIPIEDIGKVSLGVDEEPPPVSCTCVAFAKTEAIGLLRKAGPKRKSWQRILVRWLYVWLT